VSEEGPIKRRAILGILAISGGLALTGCARGRRASGDVLAVARDNNLGQFLRAVEAADLEPTLGQPGPFTVFAPSDAAFRALPRGRLATLLRPENRDELRGLVAYHVVPGMYDAAFLDGLDANYATASGRSVNVVGTSGLRVNGARVTRPDLMAANGVVHVIDRVLVPA
jgi:uncharacterized surface protein with fasciclin (FAS1) repeats